MHELFCVFDRLKEREKRKALGGGVGMGGSCLSPLLLTVYQCVQSIDRLTRLSSLSLRLLSLE